MRLCTFESEPGASLRAGAIDANDRVLDLHVALERFQSAGLIDTAQRNALQGMPYTSGWLSADGLTGIRELTRQASVHSEDGLFQPLAQVRLGPAVPRPGKFLAAGRNYMDHLREGQELWKARGKEITKAAFPTAFMKLSSALLGNGGDIVIPQGIENVDYEVELALVIGKPAYRVPVEKALDHVCAYTICNDVATRKIQFAEMEHQIGIVMAKNLPTFAPLGPWLVTADEIPDPQRLELQLSVNGEVRQHANTADMIFPVAELVSYWSQLGLEVGDMITTGTPAGVAVGRSEPARYYLKHGDQIEATIAGIGTLRNAVRAEGRD